MPSYSGLLKFRCINKFLLDSFISSSLYFALPEAFNDPFDSKCDIRSTLAKLPNNKGIISKIYSSNIFTTIEKLTNKVGICCFSLRGDKVSDPLTNTLMWAHYADSHRGLCAVYDFPDQFLDTSGLFYGVTPVQYGKNTLSDWLKNNLNNFDLSEPIVFALKLIKMVFSIKDEPWEYEQEIRILSRKAGPVQIPEKCLKKIYFGLRTPENDILLIRRILSNHNILFYQMVSDDTDFGLKPKKLK